MIRELALAGLAGALRETGHPVVIISDDRLAREDLVIFGRQEPAARRAPASVQPPRPRVDPAAEVVRQVNAANSKRARKNARRLALSTLQTREA